MSIARIAAGIPTGGQFAPTAHTEGAITLPAPSPAKRVPTDRETLDEIATGLAEAREWSSEDLEWIAQTVARSGRPASRPAGAHRRRGRADRGSW